MSWRRLLYSILLYLLAPVVLLRLWLRGRKHPAYRQGLMQRFGFGLDSHALISPVSTVPPVICLHAVSVGEAMAARPLIERLLQAYPDHALWVTSTTPTGFATVQRLFGGRVRQSLLPYDLPGAVQRFIKAVQPRLFLVMETELWPNLYAGLAQASIPLVLVNARLSGRSARGYARIAGLIRETLQHVHCIAAREAQDAERFQALGARASQVLVTGNIKFDLHLPAGLPEQGQALRSQWGERPVWVAASTHAGEDELMLQAHARLRQTFPSALLILVPRHPERFAAVADLCVSAGLPTVRRSEALSVQADTAVLLGDSMGELLLWYATADIAFIGGSLVESGGHNPLEALALGVPVLNGPHVHNFADIYPPLQQTGGALLVDSADKLAHHLAFWLNSRSEREQASLAGRHFLQQHQGVVERLLQIIQPLLLK